MKKLKGLRDTQTVSKELGKDFSLFEKLKLGGTGSPKIHYLSGIDHFELLAKSGSSHNYVNFQLYPKGLLLRLSKNTKTVSVTLHRKEVRSVNIVASKIRIHTKGFRGHWTPSLVYDAKLEILTNHNDTYLFFVPTSNYKTVMAFFKKDWLTQKLNFSISPEKPVENRSSFIIDFLDQFK